MSEKGLTIIEILVAVGIIAVIGILLATILINSSSIFYTQSAKVQQGLNINDSLTAIDQNIKIAESVVNSSSDNTLVLQIPSLDQSGNIIPDTFDSFVYVVEGSFLKEKISPDPQSRRVATDRILSGNVSNVLFQYYDSSGITTTFTNVKKVVVTVKLEQKSGFGTQTNVATSEAYLMNN